MSSPLQATTKEAKKFEVGEIVQLKSGGPLMTVNSRATLSSEYNRGCVCVWFDTHGTLDSGTFHDEALQTPAISRVPQVSQ